MPNWLIKAALQRAISWLPAGHYWNALFQEHVTRSLELTSSRFDLRLQFCQRHIENLVEGNPRHAESFTALELGTGWYPVVPLGLFLCGAREVWTFDIAPLLTVDRLGQTLRRLIAYERAGTLQKFLPRLRHDRMERLRDVDGKLWPEEPAVALEPCNIHVQVRDARHTGLPAAGIDLFASTGVLEYVPRQTIEGILAEFKRLGSPEAVQSHYLNLVDQYSEFDRTITPYNYLRYSSRSWKYLNSPLTWQNRLRISDYRALLAKAGFVVCKETNTPGAIEDLRKVRLAPEFRNYAQEDLLVLFSWLVAKPGNPDTVSVCR